ncbi:ABC transporter permease [Brachybacterium sp. AOP43-C2-M15]|uniref:ABC transporter permease n=1 Tax=Brachybacterium sp. AOP43-C2-M15 TaxID=3457661 RepID=UPI00403331B6
MSITQATGDIPPGDEAPHVDEEILDEGRVRPNGFTVFWRSMRRSTTGFIGFCTFVVIVLVCLVGPFLTPANPADVPSRLQAPSWQHWLGTDNMGRDVMIDVINGGRSVLLVGFLAALISTGVAVFFGSLAAYVGGKVDAVIVTATDIVLTVPSIILLAVIASFYSVGSDWGLALLIGALGWPGLLRAVRSQAFSLREREFIEAAKLLDLGTTRIVLREIIPNMSSYILMNFVLGAINAVYALVGLYLLGLAPLTGTNWGVTMHWAQKAGAQFSADSVWWVMGPVLAISLLQLSLVTMSRSFEEILNPRLRHN